MNAPLRRKHPASVSPGTAPSLAAQTLLSLADRLEAEARDLRIKAALVDQAPAGEDLLDLDGIRDLTNFGRTAVLGAIERGELEGATRVGGRRELRVPRRSVLAWLASKPAAVPQALELEQASNGNDGTSAPGPTKPTELESWEAKASEALQAPRRSRRGGPCH